VTYEKFSHFVLHLDGVTMVGPAHAPTIGVETQAHHDRLRPMLIASIAIVVTGPLIVVAEPPVHPGVKAYQKTKETR
jgi:hypothetical protein